MKRRTFGKDINAALAFIDKLAKKKINGYLGHTWITKKKVEWFVRYKPKVKK